MKRCKKKQEHRTQGVVSNKPSRLCYEAEPGNFYHMIYHILPALVDSGIKSQYCCCCAPLFEQMSGNQPKVLGFAGCSTTSGSTY